MSRNHFDTLLHNLRLCQYSKDDLKEDPWVPVRSAVISFNKNREEGLWPGSVLCADKVWVPRKGLLLNWVMYLLGYLM